MSYPSLAEEREDRLLSRIYGITLIVCFLLIFLAFEVSAQSTYQQNQILDLKIPCINNNTFCSGSALCNITILNPNFSSLIDGEAMTNKGTYHNYTLSESDTYESGEYSVTTVCDDGSENGYTTFNYQITPSGDLADEGMGSSLIGIVIFVIGLSFLFIYLSINLREEHQILSVLFLLSSILVLVIGTATVNNITNTFISSELQNRTGTLYYFMVVIFVLIMIYTFLYYLASILWWKKEGLGGAVDG